MFYIDDAQIHFFYHFNPFKLINATDSNKILKVIRLEVFFTIPIMPLGKFAPRQFISLRLPNLVVEILPKF